MTDQPTTVLVVDDHELSRDLFLRGLNGCWVCGPNGLGWTQRDTSHGGDTIRCCPHRHFHADMNGLDLLTEIRDRWPDSRVVVHSNLLTWRLARLAKAEGAYACLSKPPNTAQLLETIAAASLVA